MEEKARGHSEPSSGSRQTCLYVQFVFTYDHGVNISRRYNISKTNGTKQAMIHETTSLWVSNRLHVSKSFLSYGPLLRIN